MMGGRCAEEIFLNHQTTGAGNDIEQATELARRMVCEWGMSTLGPLTYGNKEEQIFLGREIAQHRDYSEDTAILIDKEIRRFVGEGYEKARNVIGEHRDALSRIAEALLERDVIDAHEVKLLIEGRPLPPMPVPVPPSSDEPKDTQKVIKPAALRPQEKPLTEGDRPAHA
jgi:cell division protease FtsH